MTSMLIPFYQVDAFSVHNTVFTGNPAAVCLLNFITDISPTTMQAIAAANNLSETAFVAPLPEQPLYWHLRWFTPTTEVALCGHATLAAAHVLFSELHQHPQFQLANTVTFISAHHQLVVSRSSNNPQEYCMKFPLIAQQPVTDAAVLATLTHALATPILAAYTSSQDWCVRLPNQQALQHLTPDLNLIKQLPTRGIICTAIADSPDLDCVSRCFYPRLGIQEDSVTGSAHCQLAPYWATQLAKSNLKALQLSARKGLIGMYYNSTTAQVTLTGTAITVIQGQWRL